MKTKYQAALALLVFSAGCLFTRGVKPMSTYSKLDCQPLQYPESGGVVFRDSASFNSFWESYCMVTDSEGKKLPAPQVDFTQKMVVGVFSGERPTGGYAISIERIMEGSKELVVEYTETEPAPDDLVTLALTYPCQMIVLPRSDKSAEFNKVEK